MKKHEIYFQKEKAAYILAEFKGNVGDANLHLGRMQGYKRALFEMDIISYEEADKMFKEIMNAIDFAFHMRDRQRDRNN